jgi:hypothetical protein
MVSSPTNHQAVGVIAVLGQLAGAARNGPPIPPSGLSLTARGFYRRGPTRGSTTTCRPPVGGTGAGRGLERPRDCERQPLELGKQVGRRDQMRTVWTDPDHT